MPRSADKKKRGFAFPDLVAGDWRGEIAGSGSVNLGQVVQDGPPRQSVEFTYIILPVLLTMPDRRFTWPGVVMIVAPTPLKTDCEDAGSLFKAPNLPSLSLALDVTRAQFSDLMRLLEARRLKHFHFTLEAGEEDAWTVRSWGMGASFG